MKSASQIKKEIDPILSEIEELKGLGTRSSILSIKRLKVKLAHCKMCLRYIETSPTEEFLVKEKGRLSNRIALFMSNYEPLDSERFAKSQLTKHRKQFEKEMGIPKINKQLSTITYLLK